MQCLQSRNRHSWQLLVSLWLGPVCAAILLACGLAAVAHGVSNVTVTNTDDSGAGSLRQAIADAASGDTIVFDAAVFSVPQTITLASELAVDKNLTIDGAAGGVVTPTISGPGAACGTCFRVFTITGAEVTLNRLAIVNGKVGAPQFGGGINSSGNLTVANSLVTGNVATMNGGGIAVNAPGFLTLIDTAVVSNVANGFGGGAYANAAASVSGGWFLRNTGLMGGGLAVIGSLWTTGTHYVSNTATINFGGGLSAGGELHMTGTQFIGNIATQNHGGGVHANSAVYGSNVLFQANRGSWGGGLRANGSVALTATQFLSNTATSFGGAACLSDAAAIVDAKFVGNRAFIGGGLYFAASSTGRVANALFAHNSASSNGAAISLNGNGTNGPIVLMHTTVASPTVGAGSALYVGSGTVLITDTIVASYTTGIAQAGGSVASDYNLFYSAPTTVTIGSHSITGTNPSFVDPAADDYHLVTGSPAAGSGVDVGIAYDLDGAARGAPPTIGAYEGPLGPRPALAITVRPLTEVAYQGVVTYTLALSNTGDATDASALMTDVLPTGVEFAQWVDPPPGALQAGNAITWTGSLAVGTPVTVTFTATNTASGGATITNTAWFSGSLRAGHAAAAFTASILEPTTTTLVAGPSPAALHATVTFTATVSTTVPGGSTPAGAVAFNDGGSAIGGCEAVTLNSAVATCATALLASGLHTVTAQYTGSAAFLGSISAAAYQVVSNQPTAGDLAPEPQQAPRLYLPSLNR